jgi:hypothetical protein
MKNLAEHKDKIDAARTEVIAALLQADSIFDTLIEELKIDQNTQSKTVDCLVDYCYGNLDPNSSTEYSAMIHNFLFGTPLQ